MLEDGGLSHSWDEHPQDFVKVPAHALKNWGKFVQTAFVQIANDAPVDCEGAVQWKLGKSFSAFDCTFKLTSSDLQIVVVCFLLVRVMGMWPAVAGLATTCLLIPSSSWVGRRLSKARKAVVGHTDARVKLTTEAHPSDMSLEHQHVMCDQHPTPM